MTPNFSEVDAFLREQSNMGIPGCEMSIFLHGKRVFRESYGYCDHALTKKANAHTAYRMYSMTKLITTGAALRLIEAGKLALEDPVSKYIPAFAKLQVQTPDGLVPAKNVMTVRHLFAMQGGLDYNIRTPEIVRMMESRGKDATTREIVDALADKPLQFEPGEGFLYSLCHDVLAAVVEEIAGERFYEHVKRTIFLPLGHGDIAFHRIDYPEPDNISAIWLYDDATHTSKPCGDDNGYEFSDRYDSGGAGAITTNDAYAAYANVVALGGTSPEGVKLFKPETIAMWHVNQQIKPACAAGIDAIKPGYGYGLGVRTNLIVPTSPASEFGWDGALGSYYILDTDYQLAAVYTQSLHACGYAFNVIQAELRERIYRALGWNK